MKKFANRLLEIFKKGDMILLALCVASSVFGIVMIYAATYTEGNTRMIIIQTASLCAGILVYLGMTALDIDILAGQRTLLFLFNSIFIAILLVWGIEGSTGNRSWLHFSFLPFNIQPAEVCKITYIIILAKTMSVHRNHVSSLRCVPVLTGHMLFIVAEIVFISKDMGVALIFVFIFLIMAYAGGVSGWWFLGGGAAFAAVSPYLWKHIMRPDQKKRILALIDPSIDPTGEGVLWQTNKNLEALRNGGLSGQGLFHGDLTNSAALPARHTDSIFCSIGEQLGLIGCLAVLLLLLAIVARCIYVGMKSPDYMNRLICIGIASMFLFQILINVGVCLGLALPFFSYGGSSLMTSFLAVGIVSGIKMRPAPDITVHYIRPY